MVERLKSPAAWLWKGKTSGHFAKVPARAFTLGLTNNQLRAYELLCCVRNADGVVRRHPAQLREALGWSRSSWDKAMQGLEEKDLISRGEVRAGIRLLEVEEYDLGYWRSEGRAPEGEVGGQGAWAIVPLGEILDDSLGGSSRRVMGWYRVTVLRREGRSYWPVEKVAKALGISEVSVKRARRELKEGGYVSSWQERMYKVAKTEVRQVRQMTLAEAFGEEKEATEVDVEGAEEDAPKLIPRDHQQCAETDTQYTEPLSSYMSPFVPPATLDLFFSLKRIIPSHPGDNPKLAVIRLQRRIKAGTDPNAILRKAHLYRDHANFHLPLHIFLGPVFDKWFPPLVPARYLSPSAYRSPATQDPNYQPPSFPSVPEIVTDEELTRLKLQQQQRRQLELEQRRQASLDQERQAKLDQERLQRERERTREARDAFKDQMGW